jgi:hypothetical protein
VNYDRVVVGEYTTLRDGGLTYTYAGAWIDAGARYGWYVTVRRMGQWKGSPSGSFPNRPGLNPSAAVTRLAESSIEALIQVQKSKGFFATLGPH